MKISIDNNVYTTYSSIMREYNISYCRLKTIINEKGTELTSNDLIATSIYRLCRENNVSYQKALRKVRLNNNINEVINELKNENVPIIYTMGDKIFDTEEDMYNALNIKKASVYRYSIRHNISFEEALVHYKNKYLIRIGVYNENK